MPLWVDSDSSSTSSTVLRFKIGSNMWTMRAARCPCLIFHGSSWRSVPAHPHVHCRLTHGVALRHQAPHNRCSCTVKREAEPERSIPARSVASPRRLSVWTVCSVCRVCALSDCRSVCHPTVRIRPFGLSGCLAAEDVHREQGHAKGGSQAPL